MQHELKTKPSPHKIGLINGLRGLAILLVVLHHLLIPYTGTNPVHPGQIAGDGWLAVLVNNASLGVDLFFILSGFVLYLPYATGHRNIDSPGDFRLFYLHRAKRLLPLFYFIVLVTLSLHSKAPFGAKNWYLELVGLLSTLFIFSPHGFLPPSNVVLWSVGVEIWFSVLFPWLLLLIGKWKIEKVLALTLVLCTAFNIVGQMIPVDGVGSFRPFTRGLFGSCYEFVLGMYVCDRYLKGLEDGGLRQRHARWLFFGLFIIAAGIGLPRAIGLSGVVAIGHVVMIIGFSLLLLGLLSGRSVVKRLLENWTLQVLGCMCYSIYAWHGIVLNEMIPSDSWLSETLRLLLPFLGMTLGISVLSYRYIEFGQERNWRSLFLLGPASRKVPKDKAMLFEAPAALAEEKLT